MQRKLTAILSADIVGYSRLMELDEAETLNHLKSVRRELVDPCVSSHHGRIVKLMGDGVLVEFASIVDAVGCAIEIQRGMRESAPQVSGDQRMSFRIGVNLGDIIADDDDIYGEGVNVAARLQSTVSCRPLLSLHQSAVRLVFPLRPGAPCRHEPASRGS